MNEQLIAIRRNVERVDAEGGSGDRFPAKDVLEMLDVYASEVVRLQAETLEANIAAAAALSQLTEERLFYVQLRNERDHLRVALVSAAIPLEVIRATEWEKNPSWLSPALKVEVDAAVLGIRAAIGLDNPAEEATNGTR